MSRLLSTVCRLIAVSIVVLMPAAILAQGQGASEGVNIITTDGVKLRGTYYPAAKKCNATVIMLHPIGDGKSMKVPEWKRLAESLQKADCSVLMFDFRGHGDSTTIEDDMAFFNARSANGNFPNKMYVKLKSKDTIEVKDYIKQLGGYAPVLINDIAAARGWLERRNDTSKDCNTSNLIVIGADSGATIGAIWINSEWQRCKYTPPQNMFMKGVFDPRSEGADIIGAVFLSIEPKLDKSRNISLPSVLKVACKDHAMATLLLGGKDDAKYNKTLESKLKVAKSPKHQYIGAVDLKTDLSGVKLLTKGLKADEAIVEYINNVVDNRKNEWVEREYDKNVYMWRLPNGGGLLAKKKGDRSLVFEDYNKFAQ